MKASYERIVDRDSLSLQFPAIPFQMNDSCISPRQLFTADTTAVVTWTRKESAISSHALFCDGDYALPKPYQ